MYEPQGGYYSSGEASIGRQGDFYTSVSVGPIFGRLLARQFAEMWNRLGRPQDFTIVEQGAHKGDFAADTLEALRTQEPELFATVHYRIVEPSEIFRTQQAERLCSFAPSVSWAGSVDELPSFTGVHFSNELLDAFPVRRVIWTGSEWREQHVTLEENLFQFTTGAVCEDAEAKDLLGKIPATLPAGYVTEINQQAHRWLRSIVDRIERGWVLAIDYGHPRSEFFRPNRVDGTLTGYSHHRRVTDPLSEPGTVDLTSHVEFTSLAETAESSGLELAGYADQHHFMVGLSRLHFSDAHGDLSLDQQKELRGFKTLMHPNLMGLSFKAICFAKTGCNQTPLAGFAFAKDAHEILELTPRPPQSGF